MNLVFAALILSSISALADNASVDLLWKARGLQAQERLIALDKKDAKKLTAKEKCEQLLEKAFVTHAIPEARKMVVRELKPGAFQRIIAIAEDGAKDPRDILFIGVAYEPKESTPSMYTLINLPKSFGMSTVKGAESIWNFTSKECMFQFMIGDPLSPVVSESK